MDSGVLFLILWFVSGIICAAISAIHDIVIYKIKLDKRDYFGMGAMVVFGFFSIPMLILFTYQDYKERNNRYDSFK